MINWQSTTKPHLAMKIGGVFLCTSFIVRGFILVLAFTNGSNEWITWQRVGHPMVDLGIGLCLWQGWKSCRLGAILWAAWVMVITGIEAVRLGPFGVQYFNLIPQTALWVALIFVLTEKNTARRIWTAVTIFMVGYLGAFALAFLAILSLLWGLD